LKFKQPIFIIGHSRSGTTILYRLFTAHKDTAYPEYYSSKFYKHPWMFRFISLAMKYRKLRYNINRPIPKQGTIWGRFYSAYDYLDESKVTEDIKNYYDKVIKYQLKAFNATRFVSKNPRNYLRIRWIDAMFPNAVYIIISRDKKSVLSSMYQKIQKKKKKWNAEFPGESNELLGYADIKKIIGTNCSDMEACIAHYELHKKSLEKDLPTITDRTITIEYEELIKEPINTVKKLYEFTNLEWYDELNKVIPKKLQLANNEKWKSLPEDEKKIMLEYTDKNKTSDRSNE
jgi:hypothetical protein